MSNLVQRHMESMTEEIAEMRRTKLYTDEQTKFILKKRKEFEYKINGVAKNLQDFKDYIQFEKILIKQIRARRNKNKISERKGFLEYKILKRIRQLYEIAIQRFSNDFPLYLAYFKFCTQFSFNGAASMAVQNMIRNFSDNPEVWHMASAWHAYDRKDINEALNVLHKGLTMHNKCQMLYFEAIKLELYNMKNVGNPTSESDQPKTPEELAEQELACKEILLYIQSIFTNIKDFNFYIEILKSLEAYEYTKSVQDIIIEKLLADHSDEETVWHTLAQRERFGFHYGLEETPRKNIKFRVERCVEKYETGLKKVKLERKSALWTLYLDCLVELQQNNTSETLIKTSTLKNALENASNEKIALSEKYYIAWIELVKDEEYLEKALEKATDALPESLELWKLRLKYAIMKKSIAKINIVFKLGQMHLKEKATPLWLMFIRHHYLVSDYNHIKAIYADGIKAPKEISHVLKPLYIQWIVCSKGITETREVYNVIANQKPYCKELHEAMAKLESMELEKNLEAWEKPYQLSCQQFGSEDIDVWINYIKFCILYFNDFNDKIQTIYREAENTLPALLQSNFKEKYADTLAKL